MLLAWVQMSMLLNGTWPVVNLESPMEVVYYWCLSLIKGLQSVQPTSAGTISKFFLVVIIKQPAYFRVKLLQGVSPPPYAAAGFRTQAFIHNLIPFNQLIGPLLTDQSSEGFSNLGILSRWVLKTKFSFVGSTLCKATIGYRSL